MFYDIEINEEEKIKISKGIKSIKSGIRNRKNIKKL